MMMKMHVSVVVCGHTEQEAKKKMDDWIKSHPDEEVFGSLNQNHLSQRVNGVVQS